MTDAIAESMSAGRGMTRLRQGLGAGAAIGLAGAAATGIWLWSGYYPPAPGSGAAGVSPAAVDTAQMQDWHVGASAAATVLGGLWVVLTLSRVLATPRHHRGPGGLVLALGGTALVLVGTTAAWITGPMLAWQQIALWTVTVGTEVAGLEVGDTRVRFYLIGGRQVAPADFFTTARLHALAIPVALLLAGTALAMAARSRRTDDEPPSPITDC